MSRAYLFVWSGRGFLLRSRWHLPLLALYFLRLCWRIEIAKRDGGAVKLLGGKEP